MKPLSADQKVFLTELGNAYPDPIPSPNRNTTLSSLVRKGLARKLLVPRSRFLDVHLTADGVAALEAIAPDTYARVAQAVATRAGVPK
jgi:hypothetical protein